MLENWNDLSPGKLIVLIVVGALIARLVLDILKGNSSEKPGG